MTELDRLEALEKEATDNPFSLTKNMAYTAELKDAAPALIAVARAAERKSYRRPGMANSRGFEDLAAIDAALARLDSGGMRRERQSRPG